MKIEFEKYFQGELSDDERRRLEQELANDPQLNAEFEAGQDFLEQLKTQMLREKVKAAMAANPDEGPEPGPAKKSTRWWPLALAIVAGLAVWALWPHITPTAIEEPTAPSNSEPANNWPIEEPAPVQPETAPESTPAQPPVDKKDDQPTRPIAGTLPDPVEAHSLEGLRGGGNEDSPWKLLVEKVWYAPFPGQAGDYPARLRPVANLLQQQKTDEAFSMLMGMEADGPAKDSLALLKGYCLLQMWEGRAALAQLDGLKGKKLPWQAEVEWYSGMAYLLTGEKEKALGVFREVAKGGKAPFSNKAKQILATIR